ncbi:hypothetical protein D3C75_1045860 [compost metagenome]
MVSGNDFDEFPRTLIEQDVVFEDIHQVGLGACAFQQSFHVHDAGAVLMQALPVVEVLKLAGDRTDLGINAIAQDDEGIVVEEMRDGVLVVRKVLLVGRLDVLVDILELHKYERDAVNEADNVCAAAIEVAFDPELPHDQEVVF